jgi:O-antigen/teichoic acid export membrane protein
MSRSIKKNYILNLINTGSQVLFPLITFPYASRIMMADGIGEVNFFTSIITYISLFTCLGIPMYAIREVAMVRDNIRETNKVTVEILLLHTFLTILGYVAVGVICMTVTKVRSDIPLFLILSATIFFTAIGCEWFYQGIEDFKYITIRGLIVKVIGVVLLFLFVKTRNDILWYGAYTVFGVLGGNIFNFFRLRKYIHKKFLQIKDLHPFRHLKPALHIFVFNIIVSIYLQLNTVMLGFMKDNTAVGYFTTGTKITYLALGFSSAFGSVMLPHLSNLIAENKIEEFKALAQKAFSFIFAITLPLSVGIIFVSPYAVHLLCGNKFDPSILVTQITAPIIFFIGLSNVLGMQILYPLGKINKVIQCTFIGAIVDFVANIALIPLFAQDGTAIATVMAEFSVTFSMLFIGKKFIPVKYLNPQYLNYIIGSGIMAIILFFIKFIHASNIMMLLYMGIIGCLSYFFFLYIRKDQFCIQIINSIMNRIKPNEKI